MLRSSSIGEGLKNSYTTSLSQSTLATGSPPSPSRERLPGSDEIFLFFDYLSSSKTKERDVDELASCSWQAG